MEIIIKKYFKYITISILILFSSQSIAVSVSEAVAVSENNAAKAVKLWSQLAKTGNAIAQYNMGNYYSTGKGVQKNSQQASKWYKGASRSGFVLAYSNLNKQAIAPGMGVTLSFSIDPSLWLSKQEPKKYTIQLASSRNKKSIKKIYEDNNINDNGGYYHYVRDGVERYALIYGSYKTVAAAKVAMADLPKQLRKKTPWVRKIQSLQNISK